MRSLRSAVVGVGYLGNFHAQKHLKLAKEIFPTQLEFAGVFDVRAETRAQVAKTLGVPEFSSLEEVAAKAQAVTIATHSPSHFELAKFFLERGLHVNVEKPMALNHRECSELNQLAQTRNLLLMVGHSERYSTAFQAWASHAKEAEALEFERHAPFNARGSDVSVLLDLMVHDLDLALSLNSFALPTVLWAKAGKVMTSSWDWCQALLRWSTGRTAFISVSRLAAQMQRKAKAICRNGVIQLDFQTGEILRGDLQLQGDTSQILQVIGKSDNLWIETEAFLRKVLELEGFEQKSAATSLSVTGEEAAQSLRLIELIEDWMGSAGGAKDTPGADRRS